MNKGIDYLKENGLDFDIAISYLGDESIFNEILLEFKNNLPNQMNDIKAKYESRDIPNYVILVHALKSNCKTLGIMDLADLAYQHEMKGKENDTAFIDSNINTLFNKANEVYTYLNNYFN